MSHFMLLHDVHTFDMISVPPRLSVIRIRYPTRRVEMRSEKVWVPAFAISTVPRVPVHPTRKTTSARNLGDERSMRTPIHAWRTERDMIIARRMKSELRRIARNSLLVLLVVMRGMEMPSWPILRHRKVVFERINYLSHSRFPELFASRKNSVDLHETRKSKCEKKLSPKICEVMNFSFHRIGRKWSHFK